MENSSLIEIRKWLKCEMKVLNEGMSERKKRRECLFIYLSVRIKSQQEKARSCVILNCRLVIKNHLRCKAKSVKGFR